MEPHGYRFTVITIIVNVDFLILSESVPSLLSMKDMVLKKLDISIQKCDVTYAGLFQKLTMEKYFLIHGWKPRDLPYLLYSEEELRTIHGSFGHPSVRATEGPWKIASGAGGR